jgi:hypothetical protein
MGKLANDRKTGGRLGPTNNPANAKWCEDHGRLECTKNKVPRQGGGPCHGPAVRGTNVCKRHAGLRTDVLKSRGEATITAWSAIGKAAAGQQIEPGMAVLGTLHMTWLRLAAYGELLRQQVAQDAPPEPDPDGFDPEGNPQASGLIGYKYGAAGKDGTIYAQNEEIRALVALESAERDRVVRYAKTAHDMGISERLTNLAERWGDIVATRITLILSGLDLTPDQERKVPELITLHLSNIDVSGLGSGTEK